MKTIHDTRYIELITYLKQIRKDRKIKQQDLVPKLGVAMSYIAKVENLERRLDLLELRDWLGAMDYKLEDFLEEIGWIK